jgi:nucleoid-associated protein YgaU
MVAASPTLPSRRGLRFPAVPAAPSSPRSVATPRPSGRAAIVAFAGTPGFSVRRQSPAVYRRRRILAVGVLLLAVAAALLVAQLALGGAGGGPLAAAGAGTPGAAERIDARVWVVRPGDTLWSIATRLDPNGDVRPLVDRLAAEVGGAGIHPGEVIPLPAGLHG